MKSEIQEILDKIAKHNTEYRWICNPEQCTYLNRLRKELRTLGYTFVAPMMDDGSLI